MRSNNLESLRSYRFVDEMSIRQGITSMEAASGVAIIRVR